MIRPQIDLICPPFSGHLHPMLAIGRALARNYSVRVISTPAAQERIRAAGLVAVETLVGADPALHKLASPGYALGSKPWRLRATFQSALPWFYTIKDELRKLYRDDRPDLVIVDFTLFNAGAVVEGMGIAWWTSLPSPCVLETDDGPPAYLGGWMPRAGVLGKIRDTLGRACVRSFKRAVGWYYRDEIRRMGLTGVYRADGTEAIYSSECILVLGMQELEFASRWPAAASIVGPMLYTPPASIPAPVFIPGRKHVLVTMGTLLDWVKDKVSGMVQRMAAALPEVEFHFSDGQSAGEDIQRTHNFTRLPFVDYETHIARYDAIVHHGGSGILYYCLRAGKPAVVCPMDYDQFDNAARLAHAGVAMRIGRLEQIQAAVVQVLADKAMTERCAQFAQQFTADSWQALQKRVDDFFNGKNAHGHL